MELYSQFFKEDLLEEIYEYAKKSIYTTMYDNIYNFKRNHVQGNLRTKIEKVFREYNLKGTVDILRVQRIDTSITVTENFHRHGSVYKENLVCFINEDFAGGEFQYIDKTIKTIVPTSNTALVFEPEMGHRILPVTQGTRYTLVAFLAENSYLTKQEKSLI